MDAKEEKDSGAFQLLFVFTSVIANLMWTMMKHMTEKVPQRKQEAEQLFKQPAHFETFEQMTQTEGSHLQMTPQNFQQLEKQVEQRDREIRDLEHSWPAGRTGLTH